VRTPSNGPNGSIHEVASDEPVLKVGETRRVAAVFTRGRAQLWVEGQPASDALEFYRHWIVDRQTTFSTAQLGFFFAIGIGVLATVLRRVGRLPGGLAAAPLLATGAPLASFVSASYFTLPVDPALIAASFAGALVGVGLCRGVLARCC